MKNQILLLSALALCCLSSAAQNPDSSKNSIAVLYNYQYFQHTNSNWKITGLEYGRKAPRLTWLLRANYAQRFGRDGWQGELEAYPKFSPHLYAYTSVGYSSDVPVFPRWRFGLSLYYVLPKGWEAEGGLRYLKFEGPVYIATVGLSKYLSSWWLNAKGYGSFTAGFTDPSFFVTARKYLRQEQDYAWLQLGTGISPDDTRNVQFSSNRLASRMALIGIQKSFFRGIQFTLGTGYSRDEFTEGVWADRWYATTGLRMAF